MTYLVTLQQTLTINNVLLHSAAKGTGWISSPLFLYWNSGSGTQPGGSPLFVLLIGSHDALLTDELSPLLVLHMRREPPLHNIYLRVTARPRSATWL